MTKAECKSLRETRVAQYRASGQSSSTWCEENKVRHHCTIEIAKRSGVSRTKGMVLFGNRRPIRWHLFVLQAPELSRLSASL